jgi:hypothetical protein
MCQEARSLTPRRPRWCESTNYAHAFICSPHFALPTLPPPSPTSIHPLPLSPRGGWRVPHSCSHARLRPTHQVAIDRGVSKGGGGPRGRSLHECAKLGDGEGAVEMLGKAEGMGKLQEILDARDIRRRTALHIAAGESISTILASEQTMMVRTADGFVRDCAAQFCLNFFPHLP